MMTDREFKTYRKVLQLEELMMEAMSIINIKTPLNQKRINNLNNQWNQLKETLHGPENYGLPPAHLCPDNDGI